MISKYLLDSGCNLSPVKRNLRSLINVAIFHHFNIAQSVSISDYEIIDRATKRVSTSVIEVTVREVIPVPFSNSFLGNLIQ